MPTRSLPFAVCLALLAPACRSEGGGRPPKPRPAAVASKPSAGNAPGLEWVALEGGAFRMGTTVIGRRGYLTRVAPFDIAKTEVTVEQYRACVAAGRCTPIVSRPTCPNAKPKDPVTCATWDQARQFSEWVGGRLPSEAEWTWAARSQGLRVDHVWGEGDPTCEMTVMRDYEKGLGCGTRAPWAPCSKAPDVTRQGVCDLEGNLQEWVADDFAAVYPPRDGKPHQGGDEKVVLGGHYGDVAVGIGIRHGIAPTLAVDSVGFRPVRAGGRSSKPIAVPPADLIAWTTVPGGTLDIEGRTFTVPAFEMARTEVTLAQYDACVKAGACGKPSLPRLADPAACNWGPAGRPDAPINCVTWTDAVTFADWIGARLPSTAEWVLALQGGTPGPYPWGDGPATCALAVTGQGGPGCGAGGPATPCSTPKGNAFKDICDLAGNLAEWAADSSTLPSALPTDGSPGQSIRTGGGVLGADFTDVEPDPGRRGGMTDIPAVEVGIRLVRDPR